MTVKLVNSCGEGPGTSRQVDISKAVVLQSAVASVVNGSLTNRLCIPTQQMDLIASSSNAGFDALYTYYVNGNVVFGPDASTHYLAALNSLKNGDRVQVKVQSTEGCFIGTESGLSASLIVDGYERPDSILIVSASEICETDGPLTLEVPISKGNNGYKWTKDGILTSLNRNKIELRNAEESGRYNVLISNIVCPFSRSKDTAVVLYEQPRISYSVDPLVIEYRESQSVPMPVIVTRQNGQALTNKITYASWNPATWLTLSDSIYTTIVTTKIENTTDYSLEIRTGRPQGVGCQAIGTIKIINVLPVRVPNAFSPNNDGKNDTWVIDGLNKYPNASMKVYNRWGNVAYQDNNGYRVPWDGDYNGAAMPAGTYYYILELKGSPDNTDHTLTGGLTIVR